MCGFEDVKRVAWEEAYFSDIVGWVLYKLNSHLMEARGENWVTGGRGFK